MLHLKIEATLQDGAKVTLFPSERMEEACSQEWLVKRCRDYLRSVQPTWATARVLVHHLDRNGCNNKNTFFDITR